ncbi:MAG: hypothetical protein RMK91_05725 [Pseudanabaenaceae cyanobacterium SKYGB_i_bin29]|nr:hypothetical protein [Pseudanabaenaceae cyanobacterium SKYG29]MDW8421349.1 hypothetical protein [Pseudanabaenaceae cyanobacterium SKYGB_i_bin29]
MPPFQSRLFRWIYQSLPFQWGRKLRHALHHWLAKAPQTLQAVAQFCQDTLPHLLRGKTTSPLYSPPPADLSSPTAPANTLSPRPRAIILHRWRTLLEEAMDYFLRRPRLSPTQQAYENDTEPWPPLPPPELPLEVTSVKLDPPEPPLQAWIDTPATSLGYVYSPLINFLLWLDRLVARLEAWLVKLWRNFWEWLTTYRPA